MAEEETRLVRADRRPGGGTVLSTPTGATAGLSVVVSSVASDAHTWNLVYLQRTLEELGHRVTNLGACVPDELLVEQCLRIRPDLVVISSVNGHGFRDGARVIARIRACPELSGTTVVIGGKLGISGQAGQAGQERAEELLAAGFDEVYGDGAGAEELTELTSRLAASVAR